MTRPAPWWCSVSSSSCSSGTACRSESSPSGAALGLWATGLVTTQEAVAGFGDPVVIFIATLFVVSEGIDSTGVTTWAGRHLLDRAGTGRARVLVAVCGLSALCASLITLNGAIAALLPLIVLLAARIGRSPSQLLMPVAFAGSAGGLLMLMSSPVNVIISEASDEAGAGTFPFFSFALVGIPLLIGTVAICLVLGPRLLPARVPEHTPPDLGRHGETLEAQYDLSDGFYRLRVRSGSELIGTPRTQVEDRGPSRGAGDGRRVADRGAGRSTTSTTTTSSWSPGRRTRSPSSRSTTGSPSA